MKRTAGILLLVLLCVAFAPGSAGGRGLSSATAATTLTLQRGSGGYLGCRDTYLYQYAADTNYQLLDLLRTGYKQQYASLIEFDLSPVPAGAVITQAILQLYAMGWSGKNQNVTVDAYAVLRDVRISQATWNRAQTDMPWGKPGCSDTASDRRAFAESTVTTHGIEQWYSFDLTTLVQAWHGKSLGNNGVLLQVRDAYSLNTFQWASAQQATVALRPKLAITYQIDGEATATPSSTSTLTQTPSPTATSVPTQTATATSTATATTTPTPTATEGLPGDTPTPTGTSTPTWTPTASPTPTSTDPAGSPTATASPTRTNTRTQTPTSAPAEVTTIFQQGVGGYLGCGDTSIYLYAADSNYCALADLRIGYRQQYASWMRFVLTSIPQDAVISNATVQLYAIGWSSLNTSIEAYAVLRNVAVCQATWNQSQSGNLWDLPGCNHTATDRRASPAASITTNGINRWYGLDVTALVQEWVSGALPNYGLLLRSASATSTASFYFASAQRADVALRPKLVVTYRTGSIVAETPTFTPTSTGVAVATPTATLTRTSTGTWIPTASATQSATPTASFTATATRTRTPTAIGAETTVSLRQGVNGYAGCSDTFVHQYAPNSNYCGQDTTLVGYKQQYGVLIRFALSSIPTDAQITSASLRLYGVGWSASNMVIGAYAVIRDWSACQATWSQARSVDLWRQAGCNDTVLDRAASSESAVTATGIYRWYSFNLTSLVQNWINGSRENHGLYLRGESPYSTSTFTFASAQSGDSQFRPELVITYRTGPVPTPNAIPTLIIGHITDAHIGNQGYYSETLPKVVVSISQQAQVLVDTGDCTENGTTAETVEYRNLVSGNASIPWRATPGNHDTPSRFVQYIGPLEWWVDIGDYRLIGINTEAVNYTALDQALTHDKPCIVFGHFPLSWCNPTDQTQLLIRFQDYDVPIYIAGHTHEDSLLTDGSSGTLLLTGRRAGMGHYRLITMRGFEVASITLAESH